MLPTRARRFTSTSVWSTGGSAARSRRSTRSSASWPTRTTPPPPPPAAAPALAPPPIKDTSAALQTQPTEPPHDRPASGHAWLWVLGAAVIAGGAAALLLTRPASAPGYPDTALGTQRAFD